MKIYEVYSNSSAKTLMAVIILFTALNLYGGNKSSSSVMINEKYHEYVDEPAEPAGGPGSLAGRIKYPKAAFQAGFEGKSIAKVFVNENGRVDKVEFIKKMGAGVEKQIEDLLAETKFTPGIFHGEAVKSIAVLTFKFEIRK